MSLTSAQKTEIITKHKQSEQDTGSPEVQVALMTGRINHLAPLFKKPKKDSNAPKKHQNDFHSRRGLEALVNKRRKLLTYLKRKNPERYQTLIQDLSLRDSY